MRNTYLLLLLGGFATASCSEDKYVLDTYSTMRYDALALPAAADTMALQTVEFVSARDGFVGGNDGALFATTDAGQTWTRRSQPALGDINKLLFTTATVGWAGTSTGLYRTANGGQTWQYVPTYDVYSSPIAVQDMQFVTPQIGYVVGSSGGSTWWPLNVRRDQVQRLRTVSFFSADSGMVMGDELTRWKTTDGGQTWEMYSQYQNTPTTGTTYDLLCQSFTNYQQAKITGFVARVDTIGYEVSADEDYGFSMYGLASTGPQGEVVAVGYHTIIRQHAGYSQNPGRTPWVYVHAPDGTSFQSTYYAADFADASTFYAVGAHGIIHRFHYQ
jgi:hypothetical protein